jgi:hypothetical protein
MGIMGCENIWEEGGEEGILRGERMELWYIYTCKDSIMKLTRLRLKKGVKSEGRMEI